MVGKSAKRHVKASIAGEVTSSCTLTDHSAPFSPYETASFTRNPGLFESSDSVFRGFDLKRRLRKGSNRLRINLAALPSLDPSTHEHGTSSVEGQHEADSGKVCNQNQSCLEIIISKIFHSVCQQGGGIEQNQTAREQGTDGKGPQVASPIDDCSRESQQNHRIQEEKQVETEGGRFCPLFGFPILSSRFT